MGPIAMTPSSGASKSEFYDALQVLQAKEDINLDADSAAVLDYEVEKKPLKVGAFAPSEVDYVSELTKGRFSVTANVNHKSKFATCKLFDKSDPEGEDSAKREFKNLKTLKHEKMVSLVDAFETEGMFMLKFDPLPSTDVLTYIAEKSFYTENTVCEIAGQVLDALEYIHWRGKVYLNLEPANILVSSGRSLGRSVQVKLANFETTQTVASNGTQIKGTYNFDYAAPEIIEEAKAYP